jgi:hypothetical protein
VVAVGVVHVARADPGREVDLEYGPERAGPLGGQPGEAEDHAAQRRQERRVHPELPGRPEEEGRRASKDGRRSGRHFGEKRPRLAGGRSGGSALGQRGKAAGAQRVYRRWATRTVTDGKPSGHDLSSSPPPSLDELRIGSGVTPACRLLRSRRPAPRVRSSGRAGPDMAPCGPRPLLPSPGRAAGSPSGRGSTSR